MDKELIQTRQTLIEGLSHISHFWGFPKGVGALFGVLYISPRALSLDELVRQSGLTKGAVSTDVRALARMGLVHRSTRLGDRKDYYEAELDFYRAIRTILGERQNREFDRAVRSVGQTLEKLRAGKGSVDEAELKFLLERVGALQDFFEAIDKLARAVTKLDSLGAGTVQRILSILK
jgi:HTH-type transcriptional regulator, glycine betaine synthesis regulator